MGRLALKIAAGVIGLVLVLVLGGFVLLRRADIPFATLEQRYAAPGSRYVDLPGGVHLHYLDQGNPKGQVVVLLHGFAMSTDTWSAWAKTLGRDYRVITLDLPEHGLTRTPDRAWTYEDMAGVVDAFAGAKHLDRFVIGGSSMGGGVAWRYALAHPDRAKGLILVDSAGWPQAASSAADEPVVQAAKVPWLRDVIVQLDNHAALRRIFEKMFADPSRADAAYVDRYAELSWAPGRRAAWFDLIDAWPRQDFATPKRLARIKVPTLILWGEKDRVLPVDDGRRFVAAISGSHLIVYEGVGHLVQEEAADRSAAAVAAFLRLAEPAKKPVAAAGAAGRPSTQTVTKKPEAKQLLFY